MAAALDEGEQQEEAIFVRALAEGGVEAAGWLYLDAKEDDDYQRLLRAHLGGAQVQDLPTIRHTVTKASGTSSARGRAQMGFSCSSLMGADRGSLLS